MWTENDGKHDMAFHVQDKCNTHLKLIFESSKPWLFTDGWCIFPSEIIDLYIGKHQKSNHDIEIKKKGDENQINEPTQTLNIPVISRVVCHEEIITNLFTHQPTKSVFTFSVL